MSKLLLLIALALGCWIVSLASAYAIFWWWV